MTKTKKLLVFAYRGEAQEFIESLRLAPRNHPFLKSFENEDFFLLITGEGVQNATRNLSLFLAQEYSQVESVLNFGLVGGLEDIENQIYPIRTVYRRNSIDMEFKSFTLNEIGKDCITSDLRVTKKDKNLGLQNFASLVDRELWGLAEVSHFFKLTLKSYKLISDFPFKDSEDSIEACQRILNNSKKFSEQLFSYFEKELMIPLKHNISEVDSNDKIFNIFLDRIIDRSQKYNNEISKNSFHFTNTLLIQTEKTLEILFKQDLEDLNFTAKLNYEEFCAKSLTPKVRAMKLLSQLNQLQDPMHYRIKSKIKESLQVLQGDQIEVHFSEMLEDPTLRISFQVRNPEELKVKLQKMEQFKSENYFEIFEGKIGV